METKMAKKKLESFDLLILRALDSSVQRVYSLMRTGTWTHSSEIRRVAGKNGQSAEGGLRRMRELRRFFVIEKRKSSDGRTFEYRLLRN